jgi:methylmalonyl-CoA mutase
MEKLFEEFSSKTLLQWNEQIISELKGKNYTDLNWESPEKIQISPVYTDESVSKFKGDTTHQHSDWEVEQSLNKPTNKTVLTSLNSGASALLLCNVKSSELPVVLKDVLIQHIQTSFKSSDIENTFDSFLALVEKRGLDKSKIKGSLHNDPLMQYLKQGRVDQKLWHTFNTIQNKAKEFTSFKTLSIQGHEYHNAGANSSQELAFTLAQLSEYFAQNKELKSSAIQISLGVSTNYFFEIAKFRAMRILWKQIVQAYKKENCELELRAETGLRTNTLFDSHVNMLRTTSQCMSAALGGASTLNVTSFNAAYKKDDEFAQRMARNTSLILKEEAYFNKVSDPSSGSYYIEQLTNKMSENAWLLFQEIEAQGGWLASIKSNFIQDRIATNAMQQEQNLNNGNLSLVGTNLHPNSEEKMGSKVNTTPKEKFGEEKDFNTLNTKRLSEQMDEERLKKERNA